MVTNRYNLSSNAVTYKINTTIIIYVVLYTATNIKSYKMINPILK